MRIWNAAVIIGSLGYFVDIFDLFLFGVVRVESLKSLGVAPDQTLKTGLFLLNMQMVGLVCGGIGWGILGDRYGRKKILFGSIFLYSIANLLNAAVDSVSTYAALRLLAGFGLAGELGAAITLVSESLPKEKRGIGTTLVASIGLLGGLAAAIVGQAVPWRQAYVIGGLLGVVLLFLRFQLEESELYKTVEKKSVARGDLRILLKPPARARRYLYCILVGVPVYFVAGILITFAPEFAREIGVQGQVITANAILYSYVGAAVGDFISGMISQFAKNRKKVIAICLWLNFAMILAYLFMRPATATGFYALCGLVGITTGYWAVLLVFSAEQFGTNIRATVTTSVPNFVRGSVILMSLIFGALRGGVGLVQSAAIIGLTVTGVAYFALRQLEETYGKDISYSEI